MNEATLDKEHLDLLGMVIPHITVIGPDERRHYLRTENRGQIPKALIRGFVLPSAIIPSAAPVEMAGYPIEETDCFSWLAHMEQFAEKYFGIKVTLREMFPIPSRLPWKQILPIFNPGLTNREMMDKVFTGKLAPYESVDVMKYSNSGANTPCLYLTERSAKPILATMGLPGLPPKFAKHWFAGRQTVPLNLCCYGIGTSLRHEVEKQFLDLETRTWFPENTLSGGRVACGDSRPGLGVRFDYFGSGYENACFGFREAICLKPKI